MVRTSTEHNDQTGKEQSDDCYDLYGCEDELGFSVNRDGEDVQKDDDDNDDGDPYRRIVPNWSQEVSNSICLLYLLLFLIPEVDQKSGSRDLGAKSNRAVVPVVPTDSKTKSGVCIASSVLRDSTGKREPCRHLSETLHHAEDGDTRDGITKEDRDGTGIGKSTGDTEEETSTDGTSKCDELDVARFETSLDVAIVLGFLSGTVDTSSLIEGVALDVSDIANSMVRRALASDSILLLLVIVDRHIGRQGDKNTKRCTQRRGRLSLSLPGITNPGEHKKGRGARDDSLASRVNGGTRTGFIPARLRRPLLDIAATPSSQHPGTAHKSRAWAGPQRRLSFCRLVAAQLRCGLEILLVNGVIGSE